MNQPYDVARYRVMTAGLDWRSASLVVVAWGGNLQFFPVDVTIAEIKAHGGVTELGRSLPVTGQAVTTDGVAQTGPVVIPGVAAGTDITHFTVALTGLTPDEAIPLLYIDDVEGLPFAPNGLDIIVQPDWAWQRGWWRA